MTTSASKIPPELSAKRVRLAKEFLAAVQDLQLEALLAVMETITLNYRWTGKTIAFMALQYAIAKSGGDALPGRYDNEALRDMYLHVLVRRTLVRQEGRRDWEKDQNDYAMLRIPV